MSVAYNRIRVATRAWNGDAAAESVEEANAGFGVMWVEVNGVRVEGVIGVRTEILPDSFNFPVLMVPLTGTVDIVYVDGDGNELKSRRHDPVDDELRDVDHTSVL